MVMLPVAQQVEDRQAGSPLKDAKKADSASNGKCFRPNRQRPPFSEAAVATVLDGDGSIDVPPPRTKANSTPTAGLTAGGAATELLPQPGK
jgi:hypothetical protein